MNTRAELPALFEQHRQTGQGAEIGVQRGYFSTAILNGYQGELYCVDIWEDPRIYAEAKANLPSPRAHFVVSRSVDAAQNIPDGSLDFVYIDADHTLEGVTADLKAWYPKVRKGGIVAGHDYLDGEHENIQFAVKTAVDKLVKRLKVTPNLTTDDHWEGKPFNSWYFIK